MLKSGCVNMRRQSLRHRYLVMRHWGPVVWPCGRRRDADREGGKIVEEEGVEMIVREYDQHIGSGRSHVLANLGVKTGRFTVWSLARNQGGKCRGVRHPEGGDDLGHLTRPLPE